MMWMPETWFPNVCTITQCYGGDVCSHTEKFSGPWWYDPAVDSVHFVVQWLSSLGTYEDSNEKVYLIVLPVLAMLNAWLHRECLLWYTAMIASVIVMFGIGELSDPVGGMKAGTWFWYCTEWCMRVANVTKLTYGGVCFLIFIVGIPGVLVCDFIWGTLKRTGLLASKGGAAEI
jgi:hypothetical protein